MKEYIQNGIKCVSIKDLEDLKEESLIISECSTSLDELVFEIFSEGECLLFNRKKLKKIRDRINLFLNTGSIHHVKEEETSDPDSV